MFRGMPSTRPNAPGRTSWSTLLQTNSGQLLAGAWDTAFPAYPQLSDLVDGSSSSQAARAPIPVLRFSNLMIPSLSPPRTSHFLQPRRLASPYGKRLQTVKAGLWSGLAQSGARPLRRCVELGVHPWTEAKGAHPEAEQAGLQFPQGLQAYLAP